MMISFPYQRLIVFLLTGIMLFCFTAQAQVTDLEFDHITMREGLSMNPVMSIIQDRRGYMWFGTQDGLNRYDGYTIKVYKTSEKDSLTLAENFITAIQTDRRRNLVIGTLSSGITLYDIDRDRFQRTHGYKNARQENILCLVKDPSGAVLAGTDEGIIILDERTATVKDPVKYHLPLDALRHKRILCLRFDSHGHLWAGTTQGLYRIYKNGFDHYSAAAETEKNLPENIVTSLFEDRQKNIWVGTLNGLVRIGPSGNTGSPVFFKENPVSKKKGSISSMRNFYSIINNYGGNTIRVILEDDKGMLWIGTDMELVKYDPEKGKWKTYHKNLENPKGINDHFIRSMYLDASGNLWIGTLGNGINKTSIKPKKFKLYQAAAGEPFSLLQNYVRAVCEDNNGNIWVGTLVGGLNRFDAADEKFYHYAGNTIPFAPNDKNVWSLCYDKKRNCLWVGTNNGLNVMDLATGKFSYYSHDEKDLSSLSENTVKCILVDRGGRVWVGTEYGLNRFDPEKKNFVSYIKGNGVALSDNTIWKIVESADGKLWLATSYGLNCFDPITEKFTSWQHQSGNNQSLSNNALRTLMFDRDGDLWIGTQSGLNCFNRKTGNFKVYREENGLPNSFIYSIEQDNNGLIWMSTNKGLCTLDKLTGKIRSYDVYDGLQDYEFNTNASFYSSIGDMYFAGPSGLNRFNPLSLDDSHFNPLVGITGMNIQNKPYASDITHLKKIILPYSQDMIEFTFSSFDYTNPQRNNYAYQLEGFNKDWVYCGHSRSATYTNLPPGEYLFRVKGTNADGVWSKNSDSLVLIIEPPFYQTVWFYTLSAVFILLALYGVYLLRVRKLHYEKRKLESKVEARTQEIRKQKEAIEAANRELEKLSIVARESDNAVIIANEKGVIEWINEGFIRMHGSDDRSRFYGRSLYETSSNRSLEEMVNHAVREKQSVTYESVNEQAEGKKFHVQSTLTPIFNQAGVLSKIIVIDADISERKINEEIIKERNKSITDSINYALRIQSAILPTHEKINELLKDAFVLFMPKDIVSGDFYFIESIRTNEGQTLTGFAVGDCTGHGVPGAFMTLIAQNYLRQSLHRKEVNTPGDALDFLRDQITGLFDTGKPARKTTEIIRDGLDIGFAVLDHGSNTLYFAGAHHSLVYIRNNELIEVNGDMQPVGYYENKRPFTTHPVQMQKGDMVYLFSDGYMDQFGGANGKKFKYSKLKALLLEIHLLSTEEQKQQLKATILNWKGDFEQTDDICVMGVRI